MKYGILIAGIIPLALLSCGKKAESPAETATSSSESTPAMAAATPVVVQSTPAPAPRPRRLAPDGTFFMTEYVSIQTSDGVDGVKPGSRVTLVKDLGRTLKVTDGRLTFEVQRRQLTNDLDLAAQLTSSDIKSQQAAQGVSRGDVVMTPPVQKRVDVRPTPNPVIPAQPVAAAKPITPTPTPVSQLGSGGSLGATHSKTQDNVVIIGGRTYWRDVRGRLREK